MKTALLAGLIAVAGSLLLPIARAVAQEQPAASSPVARRIVPLGTYPLPDRIVEFGKRTEGSIRVIVYGAVKQPGIYYLPPGSVVRDAIKSAEGTTEFFWWGASGILRPLNAGQADLIRFTGKTKLTDADIALREGDRVYFGHEVY